ncbi:hypothetical protein [Hydrogenophaga sp. OTU3427]|uniref:hypothetical protein n=1 Tax=Hydrogenophaga sp. OTU3427 TaxID=3043856 RepID=UPI00313BA9CD
MADTLNVDPATEAVTLSKSRHAVCLEAAWEIEALALKLPDLVRVEVGDDGGTSLVVRGVAARLNELAKALQSGLFDEAVTVTELQRRVLLVIG